MHTVYTLKCFKWKNNDPGGQIRDQHGLPMPEDQGSAQQQTDHEKKDSTAKLKLYR